jgi:hypothetical protein
MPKTVFDPHQYHTLLVHLPQEVDCAKGRMPRQGARKYAAMMKLCGDRCLLDGKSKEIHMVCMLEQWYSRY